MNVGEGCREVMLRLPVIRRNVAGTDLGSERYWVCAPIVDGSGREIASYGATTLELIRLAEWLKQRRVESVAMESTGVYWIAPHERCRGIDPGVCGNRGIPTATVDYFSSPTQKA